MVRANKTGVRRRLAVFFYSMMVAAILMCKYKGGNGKTPAATAATAMARVIRTDKDNRHGSDARRRAETLNY